MCWVVITLTDCLALDMGICWMAGQVRILLMAALDTIRLWVGMARIG